MSISSKLPHLGETIFTEISRLATELGAINLGQGFPDYQPDSALLDAVCEATRKGPNQYAPMAGVPALRQAIQNKVRALQGVHYDEQTEITVTSGATEALTAAFLALVHTGDEVILLDPAYDLYGPAILLAGGTPVHVPMQAPNSNQPKFAIDWNAVEQAINDRTRAIVLNFPHNPSGLTLKPSDLDALEHLASRHPFLILSDEAYEHIVFDGVQHLSPTMRDSLVGRCVLISSFAKTLHATGWKVGYCCAPAAISQEIRKVHQFLVFSVNPAIQQAIASYLASTQTLAQLSSFYQAKRDRLIAGLQHSRLKPLASEGTFFLLVDARALGKEQEKRLALHLAHDPGVATIPVSAFYEDPEAPRANLGLLRLCFAKQDSTLDAAIERLAAL